MSTFEANLEVFSAIAVTGLAAILAAVSLLSYRRLRHPRALFIGLGFLGFALQGAYLIRQSVELRGTEDWLLTIALFDLAILVLLYLALRIR